MKKLLLGPPVLIGSAICWLIMATFVSVAFLFSILFSYVDDWFYFQREKLFPRIPAESEWRDQSYYTPKQNRLAKYLPSLARLISGLKHLCYIIKNQTLQNRRAFHPVRKP